MLLVVCDERAELAWVFNWYFRNVLRIVLYFRCNEIFNLVWQELVPACDVPDFSPIFNELKLIPDLSLPHLCKNLVTLLKPLTSLT